MLDRGIHIQILERGLLAGDNHVNVVAAAQAMVGDGQQAVCIGRKIDAHDAGFLVDYHVDKARILMAEAVVILPPDVGRQQIIQGRDRPAPRHRRRFLQPLGVLVEHRIDDVDEGFVATEKSMAAGQQIAFEPAFAHMLAEHFEDAAGGRNVIVEWKRLGHRFAVGDFEQSA